MTRKSKVVESYKIGRRRFQIEEINHVDFLSNCYRILVTDLITKKRCYLQSTANCTKVWETEGGARFAILNALDEAGK